MKMLLVTGALSVGNPRQRLRWPARRAAMGGAGHAHMAAKHGLDACAIAYARLYRRLADKVRSDS